MTIDTSQRRAGAAVDVCDRRGAAAAGPHPRGRGDSRYRRRHAGWCLRAGRADRAGDDRARRRRRLRTGDRRFRARQCDQRGAGQRDRGARARLRRHVLRVARASQRALVSAVLAAGELTAASGARLVDAYVVGFEIEARLGKLMNLTHYQRGWHARPRWASSGPPPASVASSASMPRPRAGNRGGASAASGLKENFGTMVKPLLRACGSGRGAGRTPGARWDDGERASLEGPQGYLRAMDSAGTDLEHEAADLGSRWEIVDTGITVKLYPSCAATTHRSTRFSSLRQREGFTADDVEGVEVDVDRITPTVLIYDRPASGLEASSACRSAPRQRWLTGASASTPWRPAESATRGWRR